MSLSEQTKNILRKALDVEDLREVIDRPFSELPNDVGYEELAAYTSRGRGSVRLATGRFFYPKGSKEWAETVRKMELP